MRFRTKERPRGVLRASDQRRLSMLVGGVGLVLICFTIVRRPAFWKQMFPDQDDAVVSSTEDAAASVEPTDAFDSTASGLKFDEFVSGNSSATGASNLPAESQTESSVVTTRRIPYATAGTDSLGSGQAIPRVPQDLLKSVKDDVIGIHSAESEAYYVAMKLAAKVEQRKNLSAPPGSYALFMDAPNGSRGTAWQIKGQLRRLTEVQGRSNAFGIGTLYDAWVTTPDSGDQLVHVVAMKTDKALNRLIGAGTRNRTVDFTGPSAPDIRFTGYFFKREGYASNSEFGISLAPLFVAGTIHEIPIQAVTATRAEQLTPYLGWLTVAICAGIGFMVWSFTMSDMAHAQTRAHQLTKLPAHASFDEVTILTVSEALGRLQGVEQVES